MSPRHKRSKAKPQKTKAKKAKPTHRPIGDIERDIANSPAQAMAGLPAELIAAKAIEAPVAEEGGEE